MSDYMRKYNSREKRRRASYERKYHATGRRAYRSRQRRRRQTNVAVFYTTRIAIILLIIGIIVFGITMIGKKAGGSAGSEGSSTEVVSTGSAISGPSVTAVPGGVAEAVEAVETLAPLAIATPTVAPRSKAVALTFDDGPSSAHTNDILDVLEENNAHATFFVVGQRCEIDAEILKREIAIGCEIGSHSWDHANLSELSVKEFRKQNQKTVDVVKKVTGYEISLMRPPYGAISNKMRKKLGMPMILWSVDTLDWKTKNAKAVFKEVKKQVSDGDIILVHDIHGSTAEAIKKVVPWLLENDYDILTVSELMERKDIKLEDGVAYLNAK
ncbi:MAG: polysaccharide deacetylase family protein [Eubacterium sp.]|nr:polysaccharide deacetylase family protein [Eubacterium sp.]